MTRFKKLALGAGTAAAAVMSLASPALAGDRYYDRYRRDRVDVGDVVVGALVLGGIAAAADAVSDRRYGGRYDSRYDRGYDSRYGRPTYNYNSYRGVGSERAAVDACAYAAEREARQYRYGQGRVYDITDVDRDDGYYRVRGLIRVDSGRDYRSDRDWDDRNERYDERGERVAFTCTARGGRVYDVRLNARDYVYR